MVDTMIWARSVREIVEKCDPNGVREYKMQHSWCQMKQNWTMVLST